MRSGIDLDQKRARLADIDRELGRLQYRHDIAMSAFLFEEATELGRAIAVFDRERQALAAGLPPALAEPETAIVPSLARPRRLRRRQSLACRRDSAGKS